MQAGKLRHRVRIEQDVSSTEDMSGAGDVGDRWKTIPRGLDVPASVLPLGGSEQRVGAQQQAIADWEVRMRWRGDVTADMRIIHEGRTLNISRPPFNPDGRRRELVCQCKEAAAKNDG